MPRAAAECCFPGRFREAGSRTTRGPAPGLGARRAGGPVGGCPGCARPRRPRGKFSPRLEGWLPRREQSRCGWAGPWRRQKAGESSGGRAASKGAPLLGGVSAGGGGRSGGGLTASADRSARGAAPGPAGLASCAGSVSRGAREAGPGRAGRIPARTLALGAPSPTPSLRPAVSRTGGHNSSEATVTPGGSSCPCTGARAARAPAAGAVVHSAGSRQRVNAVVVFPGDAGRTRSRAEGRPPRKLFYASFRIRKSKGFGVRHSFQFQAR